MRYRSHHEIHKAILTVTNGGALLSHILSKAGINSYQWPALWHELVSMDYLAEMDGCYVTTSKGLAWIRRYDGLQDVPEWGYEKLADIER